MQSWKLDFDADKSWAWSTKPLSKGDTEILSNLRRQPGEPEQDDASHQDTSKSLKIVKTQKDLGATMRYRKTLCVTNIKQRFEKSIHRIRRLLSIPCNLEFVWRAIN